MVAGTALAAEAAGFSYDRPDPYGAQADAIADAWSSCGATGPVDVAAAGLTGLPNEPADLDRLARRIAVSLNATEVRLSTDALTAHAGALPDGHGVVLAAGTGVIALAIDQRAGTGRRLDGWGHLFGDEGSAFAVGRAGIAAGLRGFDGRAEPTALTDRIRERLGPLNRASQILYRSPTRVATVAGFAVDVAALALDGDPAAGLIVRDAAAALAHTVSTAVEVVSGEAVPVAVTGRWLTTPGMDSAFAEAVATVRRAAVVPPVGDSLAGACRIAGLDDLGAYAAFVHRVKQ